MSEPQVTVVVVPRERFGHTIDTLESIYAETRFPFRLVCVDGGSPRRMKRRLERMSVERGFRLVRKDRYLSPNEARNIGLAHVETKYVVFIDNDALVTEGWLEALVRCADETGAWVCGSLCLFGPLESEIIHVAGSDGSITQEGGRRRFYEAQHHAGRRASEVLPLLKREPCDLVEFHSTLVRSEVFDRIGPLDEGLRSILEHCDLCLSVRKNGGEVFFEPASVMTYVTPPALAWSDMPYFMLRWSPEWAGASAAHFKAKWQLDTEDPGLDAMLNFCRFHRRRLLFQRARTAYHRIPFGGAERFKRRVLQPLETILARAVSRWAEARHRESG
jgi:GT2 family glycosyltransferase